MIEKLGEDLEDSYNINMLAQNGFKKDRSFSVDGLYLVPFLFMQVNCKKDIILMNQEFVG